MFDAASGKTLIPDAAPDALFTASGIVHFLKLIYPFPDVYLPTPSWFVGKDCFPDASPDALLTASEKPLFPTFFMPTSFSASGMLHFLVVTHIRVIEYATMNRSS